MSAIERGPRMNLREKIAPAHTALVVIDVQKDFCSPDGLLAQRGRERSMIDPMVDRLLHVIAAAQQHSVYTLYTQQIYDRSKLNPLQLEQYDLDGKLPTCDPATGGDEFYRIKPPAKDVYPKYNYNIFSNPDLVESLENRKIKTLVMTGMDTQICVETAIRNGFDLGYKIVVADDLIATNGTDRKKAMQQRTLDLVKSPYGVVTNSVELIEIWQKSPQ